MKSIVQSEKKCIICGCNNVEEHHIMFGVANRPLSEKYGLKVWLCREHHSGQHSVHFDRDVDLQIKKLGQTKFEEIHSHEKWMKIFRRNYL